jgi:hypothetical protein
MSLAGLSHNIGRKLVKERIKEKDLQGKKRKKEKEQGTNGE